MQMFHCVSATVCVSICALGVIRASNAQEISLVKYSKLVQWLDVLEDRIELESGG